MTCFNPTEATNVAVYISAIELNIQDNMGASFEQGLPVQRGVLYTLSRSEKLSAKILCNVPNECG